MSQLATPTVIPIERSGLTRANNRDRDDQAVPTDGFGTVRHGPWFLTATTSRTLRVEDSDGLASEFLRDFRVELSRDSIPGWLSFRLLRVDHGGCA